MGYDPLAEVIDEPIAIDDTMVEKLYIPSMVDKFASR